MYESIADDGTYRIFDPVLAYAQVEQTFKYIGEKVSGGMEIVRDAGPAVAKPGEIIKKINEK